MEIKIKRRVFFSLEKYGRLTEICAAKIEFSVIFLNYIKTSLISLIQCYIYAISIMSNNLLKFLQVSHFIFIYKSAFNVNTSKKYTKIDF